jgi:DNA invertase Pin-like site-specific DNA recombinase
MWPAVAGSNGKKPSTSAFPQVTGIFDWTSQAKRASIETHPIRKEATISTNNINPAATNAVPSKTAISYLRVSTADQATRGGRDEGFSIPAQRDANIRKAATLEAGVVAEFVDAGESGTSAIKRPELQRMLAYVREHPVDYCIVHKLDRLARSRADDVAIHFALKQAGVTLVSTSENIDETPSGMLMHGIMSSIAEFYSRNLANEVTKGLVQKASVGGTVSRAPLGYKNVHVTDDVGRINRTVEIDPARAHLITWAFYRYAEGDCSLSIVREQLTARGLTTRATPKWPSKPLNIQAVHCCYAALTTRVRSATGV